MFIGELEDADLAGRGKMFDDFVLDGGHDIFAAAGKGIDAVLEANEAVFEEAAAEDAVVSPVGLGENGEIEHDDEPHDSVAA